MFSFRPATMDDSEKLADLLERCSVADGRTPLSEFKQLRVPVANGLRSLVAHRSDGAVAAAGVCAWHPAELGESAGYWAGELVVDPESRSRQAYEAVISALVADLATWPAIWTFDGLQAAAAESLLMTETRAVVEMRRPLPAPPVPLPPGYEMRAFEEGSDERRWLALNQKVFAHHPEAGSIDDADLALRMAQKWFDSDGLLLLGYDSALVGYCWTKLHPGNLGEIYMIGLVPQFRGRHLAKPLTSAGLSYLESVGATAAMLFAEASNEAAIGLYESMEFAIQRRIGLYSRLPDQPNV